MDDTSYRSVLHLTDYGAPYEGNFVASLRALEARLGAQGCHMTYVFPPRAADRPWAQAMAAEKSNVVVLRPGGFFSYFRQVRRLLIDTKADVLHVHFIHYREKIASLLASRFCGRKVRLVVHLHNHLFLPRSFLRALPQRFYLSFAERFVCCSPSVANQLVKDGIPARKVAIAENAIAFERLDAFAALDPAALGLPRDEKVALMFGFDFFRKGVDLAVEAVRLLRARGEPVALAIVLSSREEEAKKNILAQLGADALPEWIALLPPRGDVGSYYHLADVFLSPSREEGFCYSLVEAAYCKTPVAASAIAAQKDLKLESCAFFEPGNAASLADALARQIAFRREAGADAALEAAKERVVETYSLAAWADALARAYGALKSR